MKIILIKFIQLYSYLISPLLGRNCRFYPTCSTYARQAIERHGVFKGGWLTIKRIGKCHPYYHGNIIDEVPLKQYKSKHDCQH